MKKLFLTFVCLIMASAAFAQQKVQDVVYLKNGSVIRGTITELKPSESVTIQTADGSIFVYKIDEVERTAVEDAVAQAPVASEKSPAVAGLLSFLIPGLGQFYYGNDSGGWTDLGEAIAADALLIGGYLTMGVNAVRYQETEQPMNLRLARTGAVVCLGAIVWGAANGIYSIVDAVKGTRDMNRENGYAMIDVGNGVSVGCRPSLSYEVPEYSCHMPGGVSTGMSFRIAF